MAAEDSAVTCVRCRKTCGGEDMWDVPRQLARKIKELAESNQKIATEMKALANKVEQMEKQRRIDDRWEENEPLFQVFPGGSKYHSRPVAKRCCGCSEPDEELQFPLRIAKKLGKTPCQICCSPLLSSLSPR